MINFLRIIHKTFAVSHCCVRATDPRQQEKIGWSVPLATGYLVPVPIDGDRRAQN